MPGMNVLIAGNRIQSVKVPIWILAAGSLEVAVGSQSWRRSPSAEAEPEGAEAAARRWGSAEAAEGGMSVFETVLMVGCLPALRMPGRVIDDSEPPPTPATQLFSHRRYSLRFVRVSERCFNVGRASARSTTTVFSCKVTNACGADLWIAGNEPRARLPS
jgi:hypothetical protein